MYAGLKRIIAKLVPPFSLLAIGLVSLLYEGITGILTSSMFFAMLFLFLLLFCSVIIFNRKVNEAKIMYEFLQKLNVNRLRFLLSFVVAIYIISLFYDSLVLGHRFYSMIILFVGLIMSITFSQCMFSYALFILILFSTCFVSSIYWFYPPPLGDDTFRDVRIAFTVIGKAHIEGTFHEAYPIPVVPIIYSVVSLTLNISPANSSALTGLSYFLVIMMFALLTAININSNQRSLSTFFVVILTLSIPLISLWSVWFIPQAYTTMMFFILLEFLTSKSIREQVYRSPGMILLLPILSVIVLGHGGANLWIIGFITLLMLMTKVYGANFNCAYLFIKKVLQVVIIATIAYFAFTTLLEVISCGVKNVLDVVLRAVSFAPLQPTHSAALPGDPLATALFSYGPIVISIVGASISWLANQHINGKFENILTDVGFLYGAAMLGIAFLGYVNVPWLVLERYLGLGSLLTLSIVSSRGFSELLRRGRSGETFLSALLVILVISVLFGGTLTPDFNPSNTANVYSVRVPASWADKICVDTIFSHINEGNVLIDDKTSLLTYSYEQGNIKLTPVGYIPRNDYNFVMEHINRDGIFIYRKRVLESLNILSGVKESQMHNTFLNNYSIVYSGTLEVFVG